MKPAPVPPVEVHSYIITDYTKGAPASELTSDLALANRHFRPGRVEWALRTSWCESRNRDDLVGSAGEVGRWQIHPIWLKNDDVKAILGSMPPTPDTLALPEINAEVASYIVENYGPGQWSTGYGCD